MSVNTFMLGTTFIVITIVTIGVVALTYLEEKEKKLKSHER